MDNSRKTAIVAEGIFLWSKVQDRPDPCDKDAWKRWASLYPSMVELAKAEQYRLFDLLLHT